MLLSFRMVKIADFMKKTYKIIGLIAIVVLISVGTMAAAKSVNPLAQIKNKISAFVFGDKNADAKNKLCLKSALATYRASLKDGRDKYVSLSSESRSGYKTAVKDALTNLRNVNSSDKDLKKEKKKELSKTRGSAVKAWSDKLTAARLEWNKMQEDAIKIYRASRAKCSAPSVSEDIIANPNL